MRKSPKAGQKRRPPRRSRRVLLSRRPGGEPHWLEPRSTARRHRVHCGCHGPSRADRRPRRGVVRAVVNPPPNQHQLVGRVRHLPNHQGSRCDRRFKLPRPASPARGNLNRCRGERRGRLGCDRDRCPRAAWGTGVSGADVSVACEPYGTGVTPARGSLRPRPGRRWTFRGAGPARPSESDAAAAEEACPALARGHAPSGYNQAVTVTSSDYSLLSCQALQRHGCRDRHPAAPTDGNHQWLCTSRPGRAPGRVVPAARMATSSPGPGRRRSR